MLSNSNLESIEFFKFHGCGNDFVFIDNRELSIPKESMPIWAQNICRRSFGVGADGLAFLDITTRVGIDYIWHFYNADGSRAEMCGNAARCVGVLAVELGLAGYQHVLGTDAGSIQISVADDLQRATVTMTDTQDLELNVQLVVDGTTINVHNVNTGVPHVVVFVNDVKDLEDYNVNSQGKLIRYNEYYMPKGTNVNFAAIIDQAHITIRTYERGVEGETLACGTGVCATAIIAQQLGMVEPCVAVTTRSGDVLNITLKDDKIFMEGPAVKTFTGRLNMASFHLL